MRTLATSQTSGPGLFTDISVDERLRTSLPTNLFTQEQNRDHAKLFHQISMSNLFEIEGIFAVAKNIYDPLELFDLFIGSVESAAPSIGGWSKQVETWRNAHPVREVTQSEILTSPATVPLLKAVFDFYFRTDLYGYWKKKDPIILSSGSFDEAIYGLPTCLKDCLNFAIDHNWYGYSHSLGRMSTRETLAELESARFGSSLLVSPNEIVITLGGTSAVASIADFLSMRACNKAQLALCAIPNYPPLLAAISKRYRVELVPTPIEENHTDISQLIAAITTRKPQLVLLQTVTNPTGLRVAEDQLAELLRIIPHNCYVILDECHNLFGPHIELTPERRRPNVITVQSLSKLWAAPGLKVGWMVVSSGFADEFYEHASTTYGGPPSISYLLLEIFGIFESARFQGRLDLPATIARISPDYGLNKETITRGFEDYLNSFNILHNRVLHARMLTVDALAKGRCEVLVPDYSINLVTRSGNRPSYISYRDIVNSANVSVYPGLLCAAGGPGLIRISPCMSEPVLLEALQRIIKWAGGCR